MFSREFFLYVSENYSFIFTRIYLNLKEIILKGTITWSEMGQQTNEAKEVYYKSSSKYAVPYYGEVSSSILWSSDHCQNKVSADQYHMIKLRAQV